MVWSMAIVFLHERETTVAVDQRDEAGHELLQLMPAEQDRVLRNRTDDKAEHGALIYDLYMAFKCYYVSSGLLI